jgi:CheY-like chemotaxis protein
MQSPLRILHLEDDPKDAELIQAMVETEGIICHVTRVETQADFVASLSRVALTSSLQIIPFPPSTVFLH